jgi:hypothetical protein
MRLKDFVIMNTPFRVFRRCFQIALFGTFSLVVLSCTKLFAENAVSTPQASQSEKMPVVTLAGLLNEMVDYDSVAR